MAVFEQTAEPTHEIPGNVKETMDLHRALMRGSGFFDWMTRPTSDIVEVMAVTSLQDTTTPTPKLRDLPVINFLQIDDDKFVDALIDEALPQDRARFRQYLSNRALGLGIVTAVSYKAQQSRTHVTTAGNAADTRSRDLALARQRHLLQQPWLCKPRLATSSVPVPPTLPSTTSLPASTASPQA